MWPLLLRRTLLLHVVSSILGRVRRRVVRRSLLLLWRARSLLLLLLLLLLLAESVLRDGCVSLIQDNYLAWRAVRAEAHVNVLIHCRHVLGPDVFCDLGGSLQ
jgi:hypothetical protein